MLRQVLELPNEKQSHRTYVMFSSKCHPKTDTTVVHLLDDKAETLQHSRGGRRETSSFAGDQQKSSLFHLCLYNLQMQWNNFASASWPQIWNFFPYYICVFVIDVITKHRFIWKLTNLLHKKPLLQLLLKGPMRSQKSQFLKSWMTLLMLSFLSIRLYYTFSQKPLFLSWLHQSRVQQSSFLLC